MFLPMYCPRTIQAIGPWMGVISQFEQHVRAVSGLPVLKPVAHSHVTMINLIGMT